MLSAAHTVLPEGWTLWIIVGTLVSAQGNVQENA
jgi:hypothetical protein